MMPPLPEWFVSEVKDRLGKGQSSATIALAMTRKYAIVIRCDEILQAAKQ